MMRNIFSTIWYNMLRADGTLYSAWVDCNGLKPVVTKCFGPMALLISSYSCRWHIYRVWLYCNGLKPVVTKYFGPMALLPGLGWLQRVKTRCYKIFRADGPVRLLSVPTAFLPGLALLQGVKTRCYKMFGPMALLGSYPCRQHFYQV